jgi:hypothetical protein
MKRIGWVLAGILILVVSEVQGEQSKPRVYVTDSTSWEISGGWGESGGAGGGSMRGGARPQTAEIIKTFGERCPEIIVNNKKELANFVVILDHEGGKGIARKRNKIAVFNRGGNSIFSDSTRSLGNSVKDACTAIVSDFDQSPQKPISSPDETVHEPHPVIITVPSQPVAPIVDPDPSNNTAEELVSLLVKSTPDGGDISVDGKFVGNSPSTLKLPPGDHTVVVTAAGFKDWQRTIVLVSGSTITLNAKLEKARFSVH